MNDQTLTLHKLYLPTAIVVVIVSIIYLTIQAATAGARLSELENERAMLEREIQNMAIVLADSTSLTNISESAEDKGFVVDAETVYLGEIDAFADSQASNF